MNVASLERCRELYELSGWADTDYTYYANAGQHSGTMMHRSLVFDKPDNLPAYDLGYLLRKLPELVTTDTYSDFLEIKKSSGQYLAYYSFSERVVADTPENAAAKLAIELFKAGVLKR